jgi:CO/xanthine dehydrogenase Mo-binding subunit
VLPTGQVLQGSAPLPQVIDACTSMPLPAHVDLVDRDLVTLPGGAGNVGRGEGLRRGTGFALGFKNIGYSEGFDDFHQARVTLWRGSDGPIAEVRTAAVEVGQGLGAVMTQVVRTELGIENVVLHTADTELESAGSTSASRQTLMASGALQLACRGVLEELGRRAGAPSVAETTTIEEGRVAVEGRAVGDLMDLLEEPVVATRTFRHRPTTPMDEKGQGDLHPMFSFAAMRAVVDVDRDLGLVRVVHLDSVVDVGTAINPQLVEGQSEGGAAMGLGLAVMEELQVRDGVIRNPSFTDYLLPRSSMPPRSTPSSWKNPSPAPPSA